MCADGRREHLDIRSSSGEQGWRDLATIAAMGATKGLLVAELPANAPLDVSSSDFVKQWVMRAHVPKSITFVDEPGMSLGHSQSNAPFGLAAYPPSSTQEVFARMLQFKSATASSKVTMRIYDESQGQGKIDDRHHDLPEDRRAKGGSRWASWLKFARNAVLFVSMVCLSHEVIKVKDYFSEQPKTPNVDWVDHAKNQVQSPGSTQAAVLTPMDDLAHLSDEARAMEELRRKLNYVEVSYQGRKVMVLDAPSKVLLTQQAAKASELTQTGLNWKDLYGVIHAETAWIPRDGMGKNGVVSEGLAQMEPATAKALGIKDSNDDVQAVFGAAKLLKEAALWSKTKVSKLSLPKNEFNQKLREGVSIYYNLSSAARRTWDVWNTDQMPIETNHHIKNARDGALYAGQIEAKFRSMELAQSRAARSVQTQSLQSKDEYVPRRRYAMAN